jgi:signal transduction histidine kinase
MGVFYFTPLFIAGLAVTAYLCIILVLCLKFRASTTGRLAILIMTCASLYALLFTISFSYFDPSISGLLVFLQLPSRLLLPVLFFLFILVYFGETGSLSPRLLAVSLVVPLLLLVFAGTNPLHSLFVSNFTTTVSGGIVISSFTPEIGFWINSIYTYTLVISGVSLALSRFFRSPRIYRSQIAMILAAFVLPFFIHIVLILAPGSPITVLFFLVSFTISASALYLATSRFKLLTLTPVAFPVLLDRMIDGVFIINPEGRVVEANPASARIVGMDRETLIGQPIYSFIPWSTTFSRAEKGQDAAVTVSLAPGGEPRFYDQRVIPLPVNGTVDGGAIIVLHDSHTRHMTELSLKQANEKLQLLTSVTRHDILNTITALMGYLELAKDGPIPQETGEALESAMDQTDVLKSQITFTRDYQTLGLESARWQDVADVVQRSLPERVTSLVHVSPSLAGVRVFADPMFGRVFYNLIDNSLRHGGGVTRIRIGGTETPGGFLVTCEDDGVGIPFADKDRIFEKGYGKNTGLGLFLVSEILSLTGITIRETGSPGKGARFELLVPRGGYRASGKDPGEGA